MHVRRMSMSDLPRTAAVTAEAFKTDGFFNYVCPHLHEYPEDFRAFFLRSQRRRMNQVGMIMLVAETDASDPEGEGKVVGLASWERVGVSETAKEWKRPNTGLGKRLERGLLYLEELYATMIIGDRAVDKQRVSEFFASLSGNFPEEIFQEYWYLHVLVIDPAVQRRGVGTMLIKWGLERANEEGCCSVLETSVVGQPLYERVGYQVFKTVPGDSTKGLLPIPILCWQPQDSKNDWVGKARAWAEAQERGTALLQERGLGEKISDAIGATQAESGASRI